jgi:hypothetical protein
MLDVAHNTGHNMVVTWVALVCAGGGRKSPDIGCCTQHESQHARNIAPEYFFNVVKVYFECCKHIFDVVNVVKQQDSISDTEAETPSRKRKTRSPIPSPVV